MKPVVTSIVALAIAIAPLAAMASTPEKHGKPTSTKVAKHKKSVKPKAEKVVAEKAVAEKVVAEKVVAEKADGKVNKVEVAANKCETVEKPIAHVKNAGKKPALHHASDVQMGGGHREPRIEHGVSVVPASLTARVAPSKVSHVTESPKASEMPALPNPNAQKPGAKNAAEKGARKSPEKKDESASDGKPSRDGELAELVARIRGQKSSVTATAEEAEEPKAEAPKAKQAEVKKPACNKEPVEIIRGPEISRFELTKCDGTVAPLAVEHLSILIRPGSASRPTTPLAELAKNKGSELAKGIRRADPRLVERLQSVIDHFTTKGAEPPKMSIVSGYRPTSVGSMHSTGRAIDFRLEGVKNEDVINYCKSLVDTGCGFYPNSSFVHLDVRDPGAGHVTWIDASGPGESPRYVSQWPLPDRAGGKAMKASPSGGNDGRHDILESTSLKKVEPAPALDREAAPEPVDEHPASR